MPRDLDAALHITPMRPAWSAFDMYGRSVTHLIVAQAPGSLVTLCGLHLPTKRHAPDLTPVSIRCRACEERLQPGSPLLLTPDTIQQVLQAELEQERELYDPEHRDLIRLLMKRIRRRWHDLTANSKGDTRA